MKKMISLCLAILMLATAGAALAEGPRKIGILQLVDHPALNAAQNGFVKALHDKGYVDGQSIAITYQNGQGDTNNLATIADKFVGDDMDLVLAIATPSAQAMAGKTADIPIIATAVTDFEVAGLVHSNAKPGTNVSGTSDMNPITEQIDLMLRFVPEVKTVAFLYNSSEDNSVLQVNVAKAALDAKGIGYIEQTVTNSNEVQQAVLAVASECDAIYLPTDNVFASAMPVVHAVSVDAKLPVICGEENMVLGGALATLGINYESLGYQAGEMAARVLDGADISQMPVETSNQFSYAVNGEVAEAIGIEVPEDLRQYVVYPGRQ
ncbi:MAG: ABC transporter substrate-binding protein [Christensenellaceae bacterium]|nr:ABC transporter substrate-binding protein [Christensenellaceae bacterium]MEA5069766.1 ABC transporter substrate-binding protein [Christensenellaceae bacterium]